MTDQQDQQDQLEEEERDIAQPLSVTMSEDGEEAPWYSADPTAENFSQTFEETDFYGSSFQVQVEPMNESELTGVQKKYTRYVRSEERTDKRGMLREIFKKKCKDWKNLVINGRVFLCDRVNKQKVSQHLYQLAGAIASIALTPRINKEEAEQDQKNSLSTGDGES